MEKLVLQVGGMACEHCVRAIETAVGALAGVTSVRADLDAGRVTVEYEPAVVSLGEIRDAIEEQGYDVN